MSAAAFDEWAARAGLEPRALYALREVSVVTGVSVPTLRNEIHSGRLRAARFGTHKWQLRPEWVDAWLEEGDGA